MTFMNVFESNNICAWWTNGCPQPFTQIIAPFYTVINVHILRPNITVYNDIEEVWRKKPRQTDVVVVWGKIAAHMLLCSRQVDKRRAG